MAPFELTNDSIHPIGPTSFDAAGVTERADLQRILRGNIGVVAPGTMVLAEECAAPTKDHAEYFNRRYARPPPPRPTFEPFVRLLAHSRGSRDFRSPEFERSLRINCGRTHRNE